MDRSTMQEVEYDGRIFIIYKMNPLQGIATLKTLITKALPINLLSFLDADDKISKMFGGIKNIGKSEMSDDEFVELELKLLSNVSEVLKSGEVKIIDSAGNYQVQDLDNNMLINAFLLLKVVEVNYKDFFIELLQKLDGMEEKLTSKISEMTNSAQQSM
uniref:phage tail assembly chaperone n=1 Tax=Methanobrevibacter smithii TaxID=2173 RepID=UPI0037DD19E6